jgi:hypothetical protein
MSAEPTERIAKLEVQVEGIMCHIKQLRDDQVSMFKQIDKVTNQQTKLLGGLLLIGFILSPFLIAYAEKILK